MVAAAVSCPRGGGDSVLAANNSVREEQNAGREVCDGGSPAAKRNVRGARRPGARRVAALKRMQGVVTCVAQCRPGRPPLVCFLDAAGKRLPINTCSWPFPPPTERTRSHRTLTAAHAALVEALCRRPRGRASVSLTPCLLMAAPSRHRHPRAVTPSSSDALDAPTCHHHQHATHSLRSVCGLPAITLSVASGSPWRLSKGSGPRRTAYRLHRVGPS